MHNSKKNIFVRLHELSLFPFILKSLYRFFNLLDENYSYLWTQNSNNQKIFRN